MDRIFTLKILFGFWAVAFAFATQGLGGVSFMAPEKETSLKADESYGESRFGEPPAKIELGSNSGYAHRMADDSEAEDFSLVSQSGPFREPAASRSESKPKSQEAVMETAPSAVARKGVQEVALIAGDLGFFPKTVFLTRDIPVRFFVTGASKNTLCIMMDSFQIRRQIRSQKIEEITFTPHMPGKYRFYCPVNGMEGTMIVREFVSRLPAESNQ